MADGVGKEGELVLVGLGLHDHRGISLRGLEEVRGADVVFAEHYTSMLSEGSIQRLSELSGKQVVLLDREQVEDGKDILDSCSGRKVVLLVAGDPMTATTHVDLRLRALKRSIHTSVVHGSSALTAVPGVLGLQHYKFGRTTTLPFTDGDYLPTSPYEIVAENHARGLHSLVLLDIDSEKSRYMTANQGMETLLEMEGRVGKGLINESTLICVVARAGAPDCVTRAGPLGTLIAEQFGPPLHTIVVPGKLHFMEEEALDVLAGAGCAEGPRQ